LFSNKFKEKTMATRNSTTNKIIKVQLNGIPETLLITVRARAEETQRPDSILQDPYAVKILKGLETEQSIEKNEVAASSKIGIIVRTLIIDRIVSDFLKRNPEGIIISLGCGLDARYERLCDQPINWYDLDVEEVIDIRKAFFTEKDNYKMIGKSMFNLEWVNDIPKNKPVLIISEGVMMYFPEEMLRPMIDHIFNTFTNVEMAFDTIAPFLAKRTNLHSEVKKYNAKFQWGLGKAEDLKKWNYRIQVIKEDYYFDYYPKRWPLSMRIITFFPKTRKWNKIVHIGNS